MADKNIAARGVNRVLPELLEALQPRWAEYEASDVEDFGTYLNTHSDSAIANILAVADANVKKADKATLEKTSKIGRASCRERV